MTAEWSVLITVAQAAEQEPISEGQREFILNHLPGTDKWIQYPPASGRGHGFETRWWETGVDAGTVAAEATARYVAAVEEAGLAGVQIVLVHVASAGDRLNEANFGLERRQASSPNAAWSAMLRAVPGPDADRLVSEASVEALLDRLRPDAIGTGRDGLIEVRFWIESEDAVAASDVAAAQFAAAMTAVGHSGWVVVRAHVASVAEAARTAYLGVERRVLAADPDDLPVLIRS